MNFMLIIIEKIFNFPYWLSLILIEIKFEAFFELPWYLYLMVSTAISYHFNTIIIFMERTIKIMESGLTNYNNIYCYFFINIIKKDLQFWYLGNKTLFLKYWNCFCFAFFSLIAFSLQINIDFHSLLIFFQLSSFNCFFITIFNILVLKNDLDLISSLSLLNNKN